MNWFLIFFETFSDSFVIKYKVKFCDCYTFVCLKNKDEFCDSYTAEMWLLHQRFICFNVWKLYSAIFHYKVKFLNKKLFSLNCGWLKETFWQYVTIHELDKYNVLKCEESPFIRINLILKFHKDCNFAGQFLIHLFFLLIFLLSFLVNLRIALYQQGLIDSYQL